MRLPYGQTPNILQIENKKSFPKDEKPASGAGVYRCHAEVPVSLLVYKPE
jgi:hypothetical protein